MKNPLLGTRWAVDTQKKCCTEEYLPKLQQYKEYNFVKRSGEHSTPKYLKTDHISIIPREKSLGSNGKSKFFDMKSK